jgi:hypothetical protein
VRGSTRQQRIDGQGTQRGQCDGTDTLVQLRLRPPLRHRGDSLLHHTHGLGVRVLGGMPQPPRAGWWGTGSTAQVHGRGVEPVQSLKLHASTRVLGVRKEPHFSLSLWPRCWSTHLVVCGPHPHVHGAPQPVSARCELWRPDGAPPSSAGAAATRCPASPCSQHVCGARPVQPVG